MRKISAVLLAISLPGNGFAYPVSGIKPSSDDSYFLNQALEVRAVESEGIWHSADNGRQTRAATPNFQALEVRHSEPNRAAAGHTIALPIPAPSAGRPALLATARWQNGDLIFAEEDRKHLAERFLSAMDPASDRPEALQALLPLIRALGERWWDWPYVADSQPFNSWAQKLDTAIPLDKVQRQKLYSEIMNAIRATPNTTLNNVLFNLLDNATKPLKYAIASSDLKNRENLEIDWVVNESTLLSMDSETGRMRVAALADTSRWDYSLYQSLVVKHIMSNLVYRRHAELPGAPEFLSDPFIQEIASVLQDMESISRMEKFSRKVARYRRSQNKKMGWSPVAKSKRIGLSLLYNLRIAGAKPYADLMQRLIETENARERVALIVEAIGEDPVWSERVGRPAHYNIDRLTQEVNSVLEFAGRDHNDVAASDIGHTESSPSEPPNPPGQGREITVHVDYMTEVDRAPRNHQIPKEMEGIGADPAPESSNAGASAPSAPAIRVDAHQPDMNTYVYVRPNRGIAHYQALLTQAREAMDNTTSLRERTEIFLRDVWPRFLIARSDEAVDEAMEQLVRDTAASLDSEFGMMIADMVRLSRKPEAHPAGLNNLAGQLRSSAFLHAQNFYLSCEILSRTPHGSNRPVTLLSSVSFEIDAHPWRRNYSVLSNIGNGGTTVETLFLGRRIDRLNQEMGYLAFYFSGETYGVVVKENLQEVAYGRSGILGVLAGVPNRNQHPLNESIREALLREHPANPTREQIASILENYYRSSALHERQHTENYLRGVFAHLSPVENRIHDEITAYLASAAYGETPFTELVAIIKLFISYRRAGAWASLNDPHRFYEWASLSILLEMARELNVPVTQEDLMDHPADTCDLILRAALRQTPVELRQTMHRILLDFLSGRRQSAYTSSQTQELPQTPAATPAPVPPEDVQKAPAIHPQERTVRDENIQISINSALFIYRTSWPHRISLLQNKGKNIWPLLLLAGGVALVLSLVSYFDLTSGFSDIVSNIKLPAAIERALPAPSLLAPAPTLIPGPPSLGLEQTPVNLILSGEGFDAAARRIVAQTDPSRGYWYPEAYLIMADNITSSINGDVDRIPSGIRLIMRLRYAERTSKENLEWERQLYQLLGRQRYEQRFDLLQNALLKEAERMRYSQDILNEIKRRAGARWPNIEGDIRARQQILSQIEKERGIPLERKDMEKVFYTILPLAERVLEENPPPQKPSRTRTAA